MKSTRHCNIYTLDEDLTARVERVDAKLSAVDVNSMSYSDLDDIFNEEGLKLSPYISLRIVGESLSGHSILTEHGHKIGLLKRVDSNFEVAARKVVEDSCG